MFYREAPFRESSLAELEEICCHRLQILRKAVLRTPDVKGLFASTSEANSVEEAEDEAEGIRSEENDDSESTLRDVLLAPSCRLRTHELLYPLGERDGIGHFALRIAMSGKVSCWKSWVLAESRLFAERLAIMNTDEVTNLLWTNCKYETCLSFLPDSRANVYLLAWRYTNRDNRESFRVPFQCVPELVASRAVTISGGRARVNCCYLGQLLLSAFFNGLWNCRAKCQKAFTQAVSDGRLRELFTRLQHAAKQCFVRGSEQQSNAMGYMHRAPESVHPSVIDGLSCLFPPCMRRLHRTLRHRHRLDHHARVQYSLFLKQIGVNAEDALQFWREEYNKKPACCHGATAGCSHSWQNDGRRYTYNIRHLYGLEGSCRNYPCYSCQHMIENNGSATGIGGCPFRYCDRPHLNNILSLYDFSQGDVSDILALLGGSNPEKAACSKVLELAWSKHCVSHNTLIAPACEDVAVSYSRPSSVVEDRAADVPVGDAILSPNDMCLAVDTDSEDDDMLVSRLAGCSSPTCSDGKAACSRHSPPLVPLSMDIAKQSESTPDCWPGEHDSHAPSAAESSLENADSERKPIQKGDTCLAADNLHSPLDFFQSYRKLVDGCSYCHCNLHATVLS